VTDAPTEREGDSPWAKLRRRKVVQWGIAYAAGAWGLLQGLAYMRDTFGWPQQLQQAATVALLIGLPIALVLAWYHGDRGEQRVGRTELAILTLLFLLGGGLFWRYQQASETASVATPPASTAPAAVVANDKSIAVLPFVNMSSDQEQEYFSDGLSEELLNLLAQVPQLRVIARTSSFSFKGKEMDIAEIAHRLNVAHVLEGSVRKSGDTLRITAQLIRASDSSHLWSQTYDRPLADVFEVQDEIAATVVAQLKIKLLGEAPKSRVTDPKAYALFLRANALQDKFTPEAAKEAFALYEQGLAIDPGYLEAWRKMAAVRFNEATIGLRPVDEAYRQAREYIDKALAIDPDFGRGHDGLAVIALYHDLDPAAAAQHWRRALALDPTNPSILMNSTDLALTLGRYDLGIKVDEYVAALDPVSAMKQSYLGSLYLAAGRLDEAAQAFRAGLSLSPGSSGASFSLGQTLLLKGEPQAALEAMRAESSASERLAGLAIAHHTLQQTRESDAALRQLIEAHGNTAPYRIAGVLAWRGEADRALEWLDKAVAGHDTLLFTVTADPLFASIHADPRWIAFLRSHGLAPEQLAAIKFDVPLPN
jgi:TolB-like protein/tetratricopeptide (TPR) repeat protein